MKAVAAAFDALLRLFFDDGRLALAVIGLLAIAAIGAKLAAGSAWSTVALLVGGTVILLFESVIRAARRR